MNINTLTVGGVNLHTFMDDITAKIEPVTYNNAYAHNSVYRGKNLGTALTVEQSAAIRNGTFKDIYPGDYWSIPVPAYSWTDSDGEVHNETGTGAAAITWRVMGLDYFYKDYPQFKFTSHHVVVVSGTLGYRAMNETNTTAGGYAGSDMFTKHLKQMEEILKATFGDDHLLRYSLKVCNAVTDGKESGWITVSDRICDLLTLSMVCVSKPDALFTPLPGFFFNKHEISGFGNNLWLQDAYDSKAFYALRNTGGINYASAQASSPSVRTFFLLH